MNKGFPAGHIDLDRLRLGPVEWSGDVPGDPVTWGLETLRVVGSPALRYRAEAGGHDGVRVTGRFEAVLLVDCRRCVRELEWPVEIDFDLRFDPSVEAWQEEQGVFGMDPNAASLDLFRPLREELSLVIPDYPVCRDECLGFCSRCGADLNESRCDCVSEQGDPRWDVLRDLVPDGQPGAAEPDGEDDGNGG
jgi:uncharacterized protein